MIYRLAINMTGALVGFPDGRAAYVSTAFLMANGYQIGPAHAAGTDGLNIAFRDGRALDYREYKHGDLAVRAAFDQPTAEWYVAETRMPDAMAAVVEAKVRAQCYNCAHPLRRTRGLRAPMPRDFVICPECGRLNVFDLFLALREPDERDREWMTRSQGLAHYLDMATADNARTEALTQ